MPGSKPQAEPNLNIQINQDHMAFGVKSLEPYLNIQINQDHIGIWG